MNRQFIEVEIYEIANGWYWQVNHKNLKIFPMGGGPYKSKSSAHRGFILAQDIIMNAKIKDDYTEKKEE